MGTGKRLIAGTIAVLACVWAPEAQAAGTPAATPDSWRMGPSMAVARVDPAMATLPDGRVLVVGGINSLEAADSAEIYNPTTNTFSTAAPPIGEHALTVLIPLTNGDVLLPAGSGTGSDTTAQIYDPTTNTWTATGNTMRDPRGGTAQFGNATYEGAARPGGQAVFAGSSSSAVKDVDLYVSLGNGFTTLPDMTTPRQLPGVAALPGGRILVAGGASTANAALNTAEVYDPASSNWTATANPMSSPRVNPIMVPLPSGQVLVFGGFDSTASPPTTNPAVDVYDPTTNTFTRAANMSQTRLAPAASAVPGGRVLVVGGASSLTPPVSFYDSAEIFNVGVGASLPVAAPLFTQYLPGLAELKNGEVLVAGGEPDSVTPPQTGTEIYTPATVPTAPLAVTAIAGNGSASVTWSPPQSAGGSLITSYSLTASTGARVTTSTAGTTATVTGLRNGTPVTFTVTATNSYGTGPASAPSATVTPTAPTVPDTTPPRLTFTKLAGTLRLKAFLKGVSATITPNEPASLDIALLASARAATISRAFNLTLAGQTFGRGGTRNVTLKPNRKLIGRAKRFSVILRVIATDAAGNRRAVTKTIQIKP